jgi:parallel beta-helix repeat protein
MHRWSLLALLLALNACGGGSTKTTSPTAPSPTPTPTPPPVSAGILYVSPSGSDANDGSINAPWATLRHAVGQLQAGQTLYLRGGTYRGIASTENSIDSVLGTVRSGTSWSNAITIAGYPGEHAVIQPPQSGNGFAIRLANSALQYLIFQDLTINMIEQTLAEPQGGPDGIWVGSGANHIRFLRLEVMNNQGNGIEFSDRNGNSPFNEVLNCTLHDNGRYPDVNQGYGAYVTTSDNLFDGNEIFNNGGYGLHFYNNVGDMNVARNTIRNNRIHDNGTQGGTNYGIVVAWGDSNVIDSNTIYNNHGGILVYTNSSNASVVNNTVYNNSPLAGILIQFATGTKVANNNVYGNTSNIVDLGTGTVLSNNSTR